MDQAIEFDRQVQNLMKKGYPEAGGMTQKAFTALLSPLRKHTRMLPEQDVDLKKGYLPFVIVVKNSLVRAEEAMARVEREGKSGITKLHPHTPEDFQTITGVNIPTQPVYLLIDVDRGADTLNVRPEDALKEIHKKHRSPLTIDEGVAIITQFPEFLMKNNCFSLLASRHTGDQRVPAIWINAAKRPNLGWCWDRNPHTWLGSASCAGRIGED